MSEIKRGKWSDFVRQFSDMQREALARISVDRQDVTVDAQLLKNGLRNMWKSDQVKVSLHDDGVLFEANKATRDAPTGLFVPQRESTFRLTLVDPEDYRNFMNREPHNISFSPEPIEAETKKDRTWLKKAVAKKSKSLNWYYRAGHVHGNVSGDSYRLHYAPALVDKCGDAGCGKYDDESFPQEFVEMLEDARVIANLSETCKIVVETRQLMTVVKVAIVTTKGSPSPSMQLFVNGALTMRAEGEGIDTTFVAKDGDRLGHHNSKGLPDDLFSFSHEGQDSEIAVNPVYVRDALAGMGPEVIVAIWDTRYRNEDRRVYITDGRNEAVIMPMETER